MELDTAKKERYRKIDEDRKRLLAFSDYEAESLPLPDRYQRIRYLREIEGARWLEDLKRKLPKVQDELKTRYKRRGSHLTVVAKNYWKD
jgi:hypothetical protein